MRLTRLTFAVFALGVAPPVNAQVCVSCDGPAATYACTVKKAEQIETFAGADALNKICVKVLKRNGKHNACKVVSGTCGGVARTIGWRDVKEALAGDDTPSDSKSPAPPPATQAGTAKPPAAPAAVPGPPATGGAALPSTAVAEPAKDSTVVDEINGAAGKTWKCVSSLFEECTSDPNQPEAAKTATPAAKPAPAAAGPVPPPAAPPATAPTVKQTPPAAVEPAKADTPVDQIKGATGKTWKCVSSLFADC